MEPTVRYHVFGPFVCVHTVAAAVHECILNIRK